jgi:eukaryotic-like serine/threonine-protein kinase
MSIPPSAAGVREGDILAGKYRIDKILGAGGMGVVVAAHHTQLDERVAIKFLLPEMLANADAVTRFSREARAAVKIKSEHVARVADVGTLENGAPYMVMEYLEGGDLSAWLSQRGPLPIEQAVDFLLQACEAIAEAHSLGIVHRDLKPANLFVVRRPDGALSVKVLDFGISKMRGVSGSAPEVAITKTATMMGSPLYMSPEQMQSSKDVDQRTDIWALGIILHELLAGESPFLAETVPELVARIISMPPPPLRVRCPQAPEALEAAILRCLEKDRTRRFASVAELGEALLPFAPRRSRLSMERIAGVLRSSGIGIATTALPPSSDPVAPPERGATQSAWGQTNAPKRSAAVPVAIAVVGLGAVGVAWFSWAGRADTTSRNSAVSAEPAPPTAREPPAESAPAAPKVSPVPVTSSAPEPSAAASVERPRAAPARRTPTRVPATTTRPPAPTEAPAPIAAPAPAPKPQAPAKPSVGDAFDDRK